jgi:hypothetical protein
MKSAGTGRKMGMDLKIHSGKKEILVKHVTESLSGRVKYYISHILDSLTE